MKSFAAWGLTLLGLAIITTVAEMLLPKGKTRNVICSVSATLAVLVIVTPLPDIFKNGFSFDLDMSGETVIADSDYVRYIDGVKGDILARDAVKYVESRGYTEKFTVAVELDGWEVKSATVNFEDIGITDKNSHIHKSEIIKLIAEYFAVGEEAVMSYG